MSAIICCQRIQCPRPYRVLREKGKVVNEHASLHPCGHYYCARCLAYKLARRETSMVCSACNEKVLSHTYFDEEQEKQCTHLLLDPDPFLDPFKYFVQEFEKNGSKTYARLSLSFAMDDEPRVLTSAFDLDQGPQTRHDKILFLRILTMLRSTFLSGTHKEFKMQRLTPRQFCDYALWEDQRFLTRCIFAIATGNDCINKAKLFVKSSYQGQYLASFCASEMIARINKKGPQKLQMMLASQLWAQNASPETWRMLSSIRLSEDQKLFEAGSVSRRLDSLFQKVDHISRFAAMSDSGGGDDGADKDARENQQLLTPFRKDFGIP